MVSFLNLALLKKIIELIFWRCVLRKRGSEVYGEGQGHLFPLSRYPY